MSDITVIGLGLMGSALARALLRGEHSVTVWNRSPDRARPLVDLGATAATSLAAAVQASPLVLVCIDGYGLTERLLGDADVAPHLAGRTLIQLSTGTPREARQAESWAKQLGAFYIDGALLCGPSAIGAEHAHVLYAGLQDAYDATRPILRSLGGDQGYLGANIAAPAAVDLAWLTVCFGGFVGAAHGARLCEAEGVGLDVFASTLAKNDNANYLVKAIRTNAFENPGATLQVWLEALRRIQQQANESAINADFPHFMAEILKRAIAAGHGDEHIAAIYKVLKGR
jgi:3-hydroxyisobutyrate dehydrogenase-like beta-hydroxyacid dehydrogenase